MDTLNSFGHAKYWFIDMELCKWNLQEFMKMSEFEGEKNIWVIMAQIVQFIHKQKIIIRDLKPSKGTYVQVAVA